MRRGEKGKIAGGGMSMTKLKPIGDIMREAEKEEMMDESGRGNDDNANSGCYKGVTLGRRRGGKLGPPGTKKMMTCAQWE